MRAVRRRDTAFELAVRSCLHHLGHRFFVDRGIPAVPRRRADIVFPRLQLAVFLDGCFWHGCAEHGERDGAHRDYWASKIQRNRQRDSETTARFEEEGWRVLRYWEHEDPDVVAKLISLELVTARLRAAAQGALPH